MNDKTFSIYEYDVKPFLFDKRSVLLIGLKFLFKNAFIAGFEGFNG